MTPEDTDSLDVLHSLANMENWGRDLSQLLEESGTTHFGHPMKFSILFFECAPSHFSAYLSNATREETLNAAYDLLKNGKSFKK